MQRTAWVAALLAGATVAVACHRRPPPQEARPELMDVTGTLEVDGQPLAGAAVALVDRDGATVAVAATDAAGGFTLGRGSGWVVAKLHDPVGAVAAPTAPTGDRPVALAASHAAAVTLTVAIELPADAAPVDWFDVSVTPTRLDGVPDPALSTLTLSGMGPARASVYHNQRVEGRRAQLRLLPGTYQLKVSHVVEYGKPVPPPPPNWVSARATLPDGTTMAADLDVVVLDLHGDLEVRVAMTETRD